MKKKVKKALAHPLISGSLITFTGFILGNFLQFLFNLFMARKLSASDYGILSTLIALITLFTLAAGSLLPTVVSFASSYFAKEEKDKIKGLFFKINKLSIVFSLFIIAISIVFSPQISNFFNIKNNYLIILSGFSIVFSFATLINGGFLQAKLSFKYYTLVNFSISFVKFFTGILFVILGFGIFGATFALFLSFFIPYFIALFPLKFIFNRNTNSSSIGLWKIISYGLPASLATFGVTSFITTDIMLVKHFFSPEKAGLYAAGLSLVGRVIYYFTAPVASVMFPIIAQKHARQENYHNTFRLALVLVLIPSILLTSFYFLFPEISIRFFTKGDYTGVGSLLGIFGVFITFFSLISVLTNFCLSIKKTKVFIPVLSAAILQAVLIWFYHENFTQIVMISLITTGLLLFILLLYYWKIYKDYFKKEQ